MPTYALPSLRDVDKALSIIEHKISKTPIKSSSYLDKIATDNLTAYAVPSLPNSTIRLFFKCENLQKTGSFKFRGATHFLAKLQNHELANGIVAYSTGTPLPSSHKTTTYLHKLQETTPKPSLTQPKSPLATATSPSPPT
jgi:threonine dehydratase